MGAGCEFSGRAEKGETAFVEQRDARGELHGFLHVVSDEDGGFAQLGAQTEEFALQIEAGDGVESAEGFVEEENVRVGGEGAGDADALALSAGEFAGKTMRECFGGKIDGIEEGEDARGDFFGRPVFQSGNEGHIALDGEVREQAAFLNDVADGAPETDGVPVAVVRRPSMRTSPEVGMSHAVDEAQSGGFAGAAAAEEDEGFAGFDGEGEVVENGAAGDAVVDAGEFDGRSL